jgi:membrane-associated phospholipid phosphatase
LLYAVSALLLTCVPAGPASSADAVPAVTGHTRALSYQDAERDGRRTLGQLPKNLGRSFVGVFSRDNLFPVLLGTAAAGAAFRFDSPAQSGLAGRAPGLSSGASTAGGLKVVLPATIGLFAAGRFAEGGRFRAFTYDAAQALVVNTVYTSALKTVTSRTRPDGSDKLSFPSGHTSTAFAWATVANAHYGWKVGVPSYVAASAIGLSRVTTNKHHLSDVIAGAAIGYVTGRTVVRVNGEPIGRHRTFALHPMTDAAGTGVGVGASFSW